MLVPIKNQRFISIFLQPKKPRESLPIFFQFPIWKFLPRYDSGSTWKKAKSKAKLSKSRVKGTRLFRPLGLRLFWLLFAAIFFSHSPHPARASDTLISPSVNYSKSADLNFIIYLLVFNSRSFLSEGSKINDTLVGDHKELLRVGGGH